MNSEKLAIGPLKRINALISAGKRPTGNELIDSQTIEFIFGIGKEGLAPLERSLAGKKQGDSLAIQIEQEEVSKFFGHVVMCPEILHNSPESFYITIKICRVENASPREVVRAMAKMASCGDDCSCGCQCG